MEYGVNDLAVVLSIEDYAVHTYDEIDRRFVVKYATFISRVLTDNGIVTHKSIIYPQTELTTTVFCTFIFQKMNLR